MKMKITDLMDLFEDENCPLSPAADPGEGAVKDRPCGDDDIECGKGPKAIGASRHAFGWKQALSLAAALVLVVLGGFGVKRLAAEWRSADPAQTERNEPRYTDTPTGVEEWTEEELRTLNPTLTWLAEQNVTCSWLHLGADYTLVRFAMTWFAKYEPESIEYREEGGETWAVLTAERVDEFLSGFVGETPSLPSGLPFSDPKVRDGEPQERYQDGEYWYRPESLTTIPRFAVCESGGKLVGTNLISVTLTVYEDLRNIAVWTDPAELTGSQARAMAEAGQLRVVQQGSAELREINGSYQLADYVALDPFLCQDGETILPLLNPQLTLAAEQGISNLFNVLDDESELAGFARNYAKLHDKGLFVYESDEAGDWETLTLDQVNEILDRILGKTVAPAEGTNYSAQHGLLAAQPITYGNGVFRWPADELYPCASFAVGTWYGGIEFAYGYDPEPYGYDAEVTVHFNVYETTAGASIGTQTGFNPSELTAAEADALVEAGALRRTAEGNARFSYRDGRFQLRSYYTGEPWELQTDDGDAIFRGTVWRVETPEGDKTFIRDLRMEEDHRFYYRSGYDQNWTYWACGEWRLRNDGNLYLWIFWADPDFNCPSLECREAVYAWEWNYDSDVVPLVQLSDEGFDGDAAGTALDLSPLSEAIFQPVIVQQPDPIDPGESPEDPSESSENLDPVDTSENLDYNNPENLDPVSPEGLTTSDWERFSGFLTNAARQDFPAQHGDGTLVPNNKNFPLRFAHAFDLVNWETGASSSWQVSFEAYEVDPLRWPSYTDDCIFTTEELDSLLADGKITVFARGVATFRRINGIMLLIDYSFDERLPGKAASGALRAEIEALFADEMSWHSRALLSEFAKPADVDLFQLFYAGIPEEWGPLTAGERAALKELLGFDPEGFTTCNRLSKAEMDEILLQVFGLGLEDTAGRGTEKFDALLGDCWYHIHGDTNVMPVQIQEVREQTGGSVLVTYRHKWPPYVSTETVQTWTAALYPCADGGWYLRSNLPGAWNSRYSAGALSALYETDTLWYAETRDEAGTGTARELTLRTDGSFSYREGDLNSEYCLYQEGAWWLDGTETLRLRLWDDSYTDWDRPEDCKVDLCNPGTPSSYPVFASSLAGGRLTLTQQSAAGFAEDSAGTELTFDAISDPCEEGPDGNG